MNKLKMRLQELFKEGTALIESGCWGAVWGVDCSCADHEIPDHCQHLRYEHLPECRVYKWKEGMKKVLNGYGYSENE